MRVEGATAFPVSLSDGVGKHCRKTMDTHEKIPKFILFATGAQPKKVTSRSEFFVCVCMCQEVGFAGDQRNVCRVKTAFRG